ncbi:hypothetical protein OG218_00825 [Kineococcus sp. NBC_00420]|uniref:hypothetical protein n=1 Tax=Kineococcus sp. NBC_00420 TaxID=2903564 RepID=UPI002E23B7E2
MIARALARLDGDDLVLTMRDGAVHSRIPGDDTMDPAEALERISEGTMPIRLLWSHDELDEALARDGWSRVGEWRYGPSADVQRIDRMSATAASQLAVC